MRLAFNPWENVSKHKDKKYFRIIYTSPIFSPFLKPSVNTAKIFSDILD